MTHKEHILRHIAGEPVERIPIIGGWGLGIKNLATWGDFSTEEYMQDPEAHVVLANRRLGVDGIPSGFVVPRELEAIREFSMLEKSFSEVEPETLVDIAAAIPENATALLKERFDPAAVEAENRAHIESNLAALGDIAMIPTFWNASVAFSLYSAYGYVAFLTAVALYPEAVERIYWADGVISREQNKIIARLMHEYDLIPLVLTGDDICTNDGPMANPQFLRERYWPHASFALEPFLDAGIRLIHHCDGNVMPMLPDMVAAGFSGFQGFQYECGVDIYELRKQRSIRGEEMLIIGGLSVTRTLPFGNPDDVKREIDYCLDATDGGRGFFLFTSNVTGVEVPPQNLETAYQYLKAYQPGTERTREKILIPPARSITPGTIS